MLVNIEIHFHWVCLLVSHTKIYHLLDKKTSYFMKKYIWRRHVVVVGTRPHVSYVELFSQVTRHGLVAGTCDYTRVFWLNLSFYVPSTCSYLARDHICIVLVLQLPGSCPWLARGNTYLLFNNFVFLQCHPCINFLVF